jgi:hypothetical protein
MTIKTFLLAGVLSLFAVPAVQATEGAPTPIGSGNGHASAAPACGDKCPVLATDGPPGSAGTGNGRSMASDTARSGQIPALWRPVLAGGGKVGSDFHANAATPCNTDRCPVLAGDTGPGGIGGGNGRSSAALSQGGAEFLVASIKPGMSGDFDF